MADKRKPPAKPTKTKTKTETGSRKAQIRTVSTGKSRVAHSKVSGRTVDTLPPVRPKSGSGKGDAGKS